MIVGSFKDRRPFIEGRLALPTLGVQEMLPFLFDTGADVSCLMPGDGRRLGIDYRNLRGRTARIQGASGAVNPVTAPATFLFTEDNGTVRQYNILVSIMPNVSAMLNMPSLLGQDIISRWRTVHDPTGGVLQATVVSADATFIQ